MSGFVVACYRYDPQVVWRVSGRAKPCQRKAAPVDVTCAVAGAFAVTQRRVGAEVSGTYVALPRTTVLDRFTRSAVRNGPHQQRAAGHCLLSAAVGHAAEVAGLDEGPRRDPCHAQTGLRR